MKNTLAIVLAGSVSLLALPATAGDLDERTAASRAAAKELTGKLLGELQPAMQAGGPVNAIQVCNKQAPAIAAELAKKHGWTVARTSLKTRNPANAPDAWEAKVLKDFEARRAKGEDPAQIEQAEVVTTGGKKQFRYMKAIAIPPNAPCLACHGGAIDPAVSTKLKELYPNDQATGYKQGDLRGAITITQPM